jgi:RNA polymerase sigma-70 factor (sigma-E family)
VRADDSYDESRRLRSPNSLHREGEGGFSEFAAFARSCQPRLLRAAYLICGDAHLAEDLLQSALVKVALRWSQLRDGQPEAYTRAVLYRDAVSWWRRHRREVIVAAPPEVRVEDAGGDEVPLRVVFARALRRLTPKQRAVLVLRFFEDHTEARTAQVLGVSVGTVKSQTAVALRRLRELAPELTDLVAVRGEAGDSTQARNERGGR